LWVFADADEANVRWRLKMPHEVFYAVASGPLRRRRLLTPVGLTLFTVLVLAVIFGSVSTDRALDLPPLLPEQPGSLIGALLLAVGVFVWVWCTLLFEKAKGTPIAFNPPQELVVAGPYAYVRNPMVTGVLAFMFGIGFLLHSCSMVFLWTPVLAVLNALELKLVEEPHLLLLFGPSYAEYRRRVPMFFPRWKRRP
jgi:protein-S-isoprenylcysteine O-methyltransferase Ste14